MSIRPFFDFLSSRVALSDKEFTLLEQTVTIEHFDKGSLLLKEGAISRAFYFVLDGCSRMYYLVDGQEKNTYFYTEGEFISSYESFVHQRPANHNIACIEPCRLVKISTEAAIRLLDSSVKFELLSRVFMEQELMVYQKMLYSFVGLTAEQRYLMLLNSQADLIQRIPQYHLASFLGVSAETLSRIRKRINQKE